MKKRIITLYFIFLLIASIFSLASHQPDHVEPLPDIDYSQAYTPEHELDWLDNQQNWNDPAFFGRAQNYPGFFERPEFLPQAETFLGGKDTFGLSDARIAQEYVSRISFTGNSPAIDIGHTFFSSDAGTARTYIGSHLQKSQEFFQAKWGASFVLGTIASNFIYTKEGQLSNGLKTISLSDYSEGATIRTVPDGICINEKTQSCFQGDGSGLVSYNVETAAYTFVDEQGRDNTLKPVQEGDQGNVNVKLSATGNVVIDGPAEGTIFVGIGSAVQRIQYLNRRGILIMEQNGDFSSENAEIITRELYVDGASRYDAIKKEVQIWDHGDSDKGNIRNGNTVAIYRAGLGDKNPGAVSLGQQGGEEVVTIRLDHIPDYSRHSPKPKPLEPQTVEQVHEQLRTQAQAIPSAFKDMKGSAEVTFGMNDHEELVVFARGPVEVGFYQEKALLLNEPFFRGIRDAGKQGEQFDAEYELKTNGNVDVDVRGKAVYADDQYGGVSFPLHDDGTTDYHQVNLQGGVTNQQDGASVAIRRLSVGSGADSDQIDVACFGCTPSQDVTSFSKTIVIGEPLAGGDRLFASTRIVPLEIEIVTNERGEVTFSPDSSAMGRFAEALVGNVAVLERYMDLRLSTKDGTQLENKREEFLRLAKPSDSSAGALMLYREVQVDGQTQIPPPPVINFGIRDVVGNAIITTSEKNKDNAERLLLLLQQGKLNELQTLEFEPDRDLRRYLKRETFVDIDLLSNPVYQQHLARAVDSYGEFKQIRERLQQEYPQLGFDDAGICISPPNCEAEIIIPAKRKINPLAYLVTAARIKVLEAHNAELESLAQSDENLGKSKTKQELKENRQEIAGLRRERADFDRRYEERIEERRVRQLVEDIRFGKPTSNSGALVQEAIGKGVFIQGATQRIGQLERYIKNEEESIKSDVQSVEQATAGETFFDSERYEQQLKKVSQPKIDALKREIEELRRQANVARDQVSRSSNALLTEGRPDLASRVLREVDPAGARAIATTGVASYDSDRSLQLEMEAYLAEGKLHEAAQVQVKIIDPERQKSTAREIRRNEYNAVVEKNGENQLRVMERRRDIEITGFEVFEAAAGAASAAVAQILTAPVTEIELAGEGYFDAKGKLAIGNYRRALADASVSEDAVRGLRKHLDSGDTEEFDKTVGRMESSTISSADSAFFRGLQLSVRGNSEDSSQIAEARAEQAYSEVLKGVQSGRTFEVEADLRVIAQEYKGTQAAQQAEQELARIEREGVLRKYDEIIIESVGEFVVPGLGALSVSKGILAGARVAGATGRLGLAVVRTTRAGARVAEITATTARQIKMAQTFIRGTVPVRTVSAILQSERAAQIGNRIVTSSTVVARAVTYPARVTFKVGGEVIGYIARSSLDEIVLESEKAVRSANEVRVAARQTGQGIADAENAYRSAEQAHKNALLVKQATATTDEVGTGFFSKQRGAFNPESKQAVREYEKATTEFLNHLSVDNFDAATRVAPDVIAAAENVKNAGFLDDVARVITRTAENVEGLTRVSRVQQSMSSLTKAGVHFAPRQAGELALVGCVVCARELMKYDLPPDLPPEEAIEVRRAIDSLENTLQESGIDPRVIDAMEKSIQARADPSSVSNTAQRVFDDLQEQALTGKTNGAIPVVVQKASQKGALAPVTLKSIPPTTTEVRVLESTPSHEALAHLVKTTDTGLPNQAEYVKNGVQGAEQGKPVQVATIDIHDFKGSINERFGHGGGDVFLREFGDELRTSLQADGVKVYHKGGKTYKAVCVECQEDLSVILSRHMDAIRQRTVQRAQAVDRTLEIPVEEFHIYAGVSRTEKILFIDTFDTRKAEQLLDRLNRESLRAGKYGQLEICGKKELCSQIVKVGDVPQDLAPARVYQSPPDLEQRIALFDLEKRNEYSFFEEDIRFSDIDSLLFQRQRAELSNDLAELKRLDYEILNQQMRDQHGFLKGNDNFKAVINYQLENAVDARDVVVVGGDEIGYFVSRQGQVMGARIDLNFFGTVNRQLGIEKAEEIKKRALAIISNTLDDARTGVIVDDDTIIARTIVERFNQRMKKQDLSILVDIEGQTVRVRPSLTVGFTKADAELVRLTMTGKKNGASVLNKVADAAQEMQKRAGKQRLLQQTGEVKEINAADFVAEGKISTADIEATGPFVRKPTDQLVAEFILDGGDINKNTDYLRMKAAPNLAAAREEAITGRVGQKVEASSLEEIVDLKYEESFALAVVENLKGKVLRLSDDSTTTVGRKLGQGMFGVVYCFDSSCTKVIKLPYYEAGQSVEGSLEMTLFELRSEVSRAAVLENAGIPIARIHNPDPEATYLIKDFIKGETPEQLLAAGKLTPEQIDSLARIYRASTQGDVQIDANIRNFIWNEERGTFVLVDNAVDPVSGPRWSKELTWKNNYFDTDPAGFTRFQATVRDIQPSFDDAAEFVRRTTGLEFPEGVLKENWGDEFAKYYNGATIDEKVRLTELTRQKAKEFESVAISRYSRARHINQNVFQLDEARYTYDSSSRQWIPEGVVQREIINPESFPLPLEVKNIDDIVDLEAARLEVPRELAKVTLTDRLSQRTVYISATGQHLLPPEQLEDAVFDLVNTVEDGSTLTKEKIKELLLDRAQREGLTSQEFAALQKNFEFLYSRSAESGKYVPQFSKMLSELDPSYTNVHLFRDGSVLGASDTFFKKLHGGEADVRIIYVSRDSTLSQSEKLRLIMREEFQKSPGSFVDFRQGFQERFDQLMDSDPEFRNVADQLYNYVAGQGLLKEGTKLRFIDTCCTGTINYFLEGVIRYHNPNAEVQSLLMHSDIGPLSAGFDLTQAHNIEGLMKPVTFSKQFDPVTGSPLFQLHPTPDFIREEGLPAVENKYGPQAEQVLSFLDQLVVLQQTAREAGIEN